MSQGLLVDTCVLSWYLERDARGRHPELVRWLDEHMSTEGLWISAVTLYELRRGVAELLQQDKGTRKAARLEHILRAATVVGLDSGNFAGWRLAADLWAKCRQSTPHIVIAEADLLILATALAHDRSLVTVDKGLRDNIRALGFGERLEVIPAEARHG